MEPRPFARLSVGSLALRFRSDESRGETKFSCIIKLSPLKQSQTVKCLPVLALLNRSGSRGGAASPQLPADCFFYLDDASLQKLAEASGGGGARLNFKVMQETAEGGGGGGAATTMFRKRAVKCLGKFSVPLRLEWLASGKQKVIRQGWVPLKGSGGGGGIWGKRCCVMVPDHMESDENSQNYKEANCETAFSGGGRRTGSGVLAYSGAVAANSGGAAASSTPALHLMVRADLDPRFVFEFEAAPDQSPQILHVQGHIKQPIFSCKFARSRSSHSRGALSLSGELRGVYPTSNAAGGGVAMASRGGADREDTDKKNRNKKKKVRERKGWVLLIHDLSGKAVAAASMVTPFVPTAAAAGHVSRACPGAWLILRAAEATDSWQPWARLEAWHEPRHHIACRLLLPLPPPPLPAAPPPYSPSSSAVVDDSLQLVSQCSLSLLRGGDFAIDAARLRIQRHSASSSPFRSPCHSGNLGGGGAAASSGFVCAGTRAFRKIDRIYMKFNRLIRDYHRYG